MRTRAGPVLWCCCLSLLCAVTAAAGLPSEPVALSNAAPDADQWVAQRAPVQLLPAGPPVPGAGWIPSPLDLSHFRNERLPAGLDAAQLPSRFDWRQQGILTRVQNQNPCGACYAFAFLASFESKLQLDGAGSFDFSENHAKECNWEELNGYSSGGQPWGSCDGGNSFMMANLYSQQGTVLEACDPYVASDVECRGSCPGQKTLLGWRFASAGEMPDPNVLKGYLYAYGPLATSLYVGKFNTEAWRREFSSYDGSYTLHYTGSQTPNHGVLIIGWDDSLTHAGGQGAWIVKNSWGTDWGGTAGYGSERGYFTMAYGSARIGGESGFVSQWQEVDASGGLWYYDDAGANGAIGWLGKKTDWGLARYTAAHDTTVTHVEFWTADATTDVDVYVYGGFDGTRLSNLLRSVPNLAYDEVGYFSVPLNPPLPISAGQQVVGVVQITDRDSNYALAIDERGPAESGSTYHSPTGADGSWQDVGTRFDADLTIRLRFSGAPSPVTPTATTTRTGTPTASATMRTATPTATPTTTRTPTPTLTRSVPEIYVLLPVILKEVQWAAPPTPHATLTPTRPTGATPTATASPTQPGAATATPTHTATSTPTRPGPATVTPTLPAAFTGVYALSGKPYSLDLHPSSGRLYVALQEWQDLTVLDLYHMAYLSHAPLPKGPQAVRLDPGLDRAYAAYGDPLYVVSCASHAVLGELPYGAYSPAELAINPDNHRVYVADWVLQGRPHRVHVYDGVNRTLIGSVDLGTTSLREHIAVALNPHTGWAYVAYSGDQRIVVINPDLQIHTRIAPSSMAAPPYQPWLALNAATNRLYLRGNGETAVIDLNHNAQVGSLDHTGLIAVDELRNRIYVQYLSRVYVYDGASNAVLREITLDKYRHVTDMVCDAPTRRVFLAAPNDNEIVVVGDP